MAVKRVAKAQEDQLNNVARKFRNTGEIKVASGHIKHSSVADMVNKQIEESRYNE